MGQYENNFYISKTLFAFLEINSLVLEFRIFPSLMIEFWIISQNTSSDEQKTNLNRRKTDFITTRMYFLIRRSN